MAKNEITLKVAEALSQRDIGQGIARLDPQTMNELGINERDLIEITGDKKTAAIALTSQTDIGLGVIRIDGLVRKNSGASIGGEVTIKKAQVIEAKKLFLHQPNTISMYKEMSVAYSKEKQWFKEIL